MGGVRSRSRFDGSSGLGFGLQGWYLLGLGFEFRGLRVVLGLEVQVSGFSVCLGFEFVV